MRAGRWQVGGARSLPVVYDLALYKQATGTRPSPPEASAFTVNHQAVRWTLRPLLSIVKGFCVCVEALRCLLWMLLLAGWLSVCCFLAVGIAVASIAAI